MKKAIVLLVALGVVGCVAGGSHSSKVMIGLEAQPTCEQLGNVQCTAWSKPDLKQHLKSKAAGLGANYVKLDSVVKNGKGFEAKGTAFACR